jgi:hypothetical protein
MTDLIDQQAYEDEMKYQKTMENPEDKFCFNGMVIPIYMRGGIRHYIDSGLPPGDFLTAVICNDLSNAVGRADDNNIHVLPAYVNYFYNYAPHNCWGSKKLFKEWVEKGGRNGR